MPIGGARAPLLGRGLPFQVVNFTRRNRNDSGHWGGTNVVTATYGSTPLVGSLLLACALHRSEAGGSPTISGSGWTQRIWRWTGTGLANDRRGLVVFSKVAGASEPTAITVTWSATAASRMVVYEFEPSLAGYDFKFLSAQSADTGTGATGAGAHQMAGTADGPLIVNSATVNPGGQSLLRFSHLHGRIGDTAVPDADFVTADENFVEGAGAAYQTAHAHGFKRDDVGGSGQGENADWTHTTFQASLAHLIFGGAGSS